MKINGNKTYIGLVVAGVGAILSYFGVQYSQEIMLWGLGFAGVVGAGHKLLKGH